MADIEELLKRLREESLELQKVAWSRLDGGQDCSISATLADEAATALSAQQREIAELRSERDAFEQSYRIRLWNELRSQGMKQDDAITEISRQIDDLRKDAKDAALNTPSQEGEKR